MSDDGDKRAFPVAGACVDGLTVDDYGMSLRDWFAGQALAGILATNDSRVYASMPGSGDAKIAYAAYAVADAMMQVRD